MGAEKQAKVKGQAGDQKGKRPRRVPARQGYLATNRAIPHWGTVFHKKSPCRPGSAPGMQGAKPLA